MAELNMGSYELSDKKKNNKFGNAIFRIQKGVMFHGSVMFRAMNIIIRGEIGSG